MKFDKNTLAIIALALGAVCAYFWMQDQKGNTPPPQQPNAQSPFGQNWMPSQQQVPPGQPPQQQVPPQSPPQQGPPQQMPPEQPFPPRGG